MLQLFQKKIQRVDANTGHQESELNSQIDTNLTQKTTGQ